MSGRAPAAVRGIAALPTTLVGHGSGRTPDDVRHVLREAILTGLLEPGSHLNAGALAKHLGVSHIPVREALRSLAADGWIDHRPHIGAFVRPQTEHELADLFELRLIAEPAAARLAADRRTTAQLEVLAAMVRAQESSQDGVEISRINADFHVTVAEASQNAWVVNVTRAVNERTRFYFRDVAPRRRDESVREHQEIIDALRRRDGDRAAALMHSHVSHTWKDVAEVVVRHTA